VTRLLAKLGVVILLFASAFALAAPSAHAIDLVVHASVVAKALKAQLFKDRGRYYLRRPDRCNDPYLENLPYRSSRAAFMSERILPDGSAH
jgi:hypothetical protein